MEVTRAAGYRVVENDVLAPRAAVTPRLILQGHAQVIDASAKPLLQAQLKRSHERLDDAVIHAGASVGNEDAKSF